MGFMETCGSIRINASGPNTKPDSGNVLGGETGLHIPLKALGGQLRATGQTPRRKPAARLRTTSKLPGASDRGLGRPTTSPPHPDLGACGYWFDPELADLSRTGPRRHGPKARHPRDDGEGRRTARACASPCKEGHPGALEQGLLEKSVPPNRTTKKTFAAVGGLPPGKQIGAREVTKTAGKFLVRPRICILSTGAGCGSVATASMAGKHGLGLMQRLRQALCETTPKAVQNLTQGLFSRCPAPPRQDGRYSCRPSARIFRTSRKSPLLPHYLTGRFGGTSAIRSHTGRFGPNGARAN